MEVQEHGEQESVFNKAFYSYGAENVSSESQTEEVNKSLDIDDIVQGK